MDDELPSWTQMLLKEIQYNFNRSTVPIEMARAAKSADRWPAIDPDRAPADASSEVLPGLFVREKKSPESKLKETVRRELVSMAVDKNLGNTGISLFTLDTDLDVMLGLSPSPTGRPPLERILIVDARGQAGSGRGSTR